MKNTIYRDDIIERNDSPENALMDDTTTVIGVVSNCSALNVRSKPTVESSRVTILYPSSQVEINMTESTDTFYKIKTPSCEGYCMREYITIMP